MKRIALIMLILCFTLLAGCDLKSILTIPETEPAEVGDATVERVVDGDTLVVTIDGQEEKLRLIGVDTPESVHPDESKNTEEGKIASEYTKSQFPEGTVVYLEQDVEERDKYGRLLVYLYKDKELTDMYNLELLEEGYAQTLTIPPNIKYADEFAEAQKNARENGKGFWGDAWK